MGGGLAGRLGAEFGCGGSGIWGLLCVLGGGGGGGDGLASLSGINSYKQSLSSSGSGWAG